MDFIVGAALLISPARTWPIVAMVGTLKGLRKFLRATRKNRVRRDDDVLCLQDTTSTGLEKIPAVTLEWSNISCIFKNQGSDAKTILKSIQGRALPGR
jgi:hypothetical protein